MTDDAPPKVAKAARLIGDGAVTLAGVGRRYHVRGSEPDAYRVWVWTDSTGITHYECLCRHGQKHPKGVTNPNDGCSHIIAAATMDGEIMENVERRNDGKE